MCGTALRPRVALGASKEETPWWSNPAAGRLALRAGATDRSPGQPCGWFLAGAQALGEAANARAPAVRKRRTASPNSRRPPVQTLVPARVPRLWQLETVPVHADPPDATG